MNPDNNDLFREIGHFMHLSRRLLWQQQAQPHHHGQARLLRAIADEDNLTQARIAEILDIRPSSVSEILGKLEQKGLITRTPDENDGRITRVSITDAGKERLQAAEASFGEINDQIFSGLSDEEQTQLIGLLQKLNTDLEGKVKPMGPDFDGHPHGPRGFGPRGPRGFGGPRGFDGPHGHHHHGGGFGGPNSIQIFFR